MINKETVDNLAKLARLELSEEEKSKYSKQLSEVIKYIEQIQKAPEHLLNYNEMKQTMGRVDLVDEVILEDRKLLTDQFPRKQHDYLQVPAVFKKNKNIQFLLQIFLLIHQGGIHELQKESLLIIQVIYYQLYYSLQIHWHLGLNLLILLFLFQHHFHQ